MPRGGFGNKSDSICMQSHFVGFVYRTETMHQLLCFKSKFLNHFAFTLGRDLFLLFWV